MGKASFAKRAKDFWVDKVEWPKRQRSVSGTIHSEPEDRLQYRQRLQVDSCGTG